MNYYCLPGLKRSNTVLPLFEISPITIVEVLCQHFRISHDEIKLKSRKREILRPRQMAMYFMYNMTNMTKTQVGQYFNGMDHTTVIHTIRLMKDLMDTEPQLVRLIQRLQTDIYAHHTLHGC